MSPDLLYYFILWQKMFQRPEGILHVFQRNKDRYARNYHSSFKVTVKQKYTNPASPSKSNNGSLCWNEIECVQAKKKKKKKKKLFIFSEKHSLLLSPNVKTKAIKSHHSNRDHNNSHSMSEQRSISPFIFSPRMVIHRRDT